MFDVQKSELALIDDVWPWKINWVQNQNFIIFTDYSASCIFNFLQRRDWNRELGSCFYWVRIFCCKLIPRCLGNFQNKTTLTIKLLLRDLTNITASRNFTLDSVFIVMEVSKCVGLSSPRFWAFWSAQTSDVFYPLTQLIQPVEQDNWFSPRRTFGALRTNGRGSGS